MVISNCVINLSVDKPAVFAETFRVLSPGGRFGVSDVVADDALTPDERARRGDYVGCIVGALSFTEYREGLEAAGFADVEITPTHPVADGMHSAIVRAVEPSGAAEPGVSAASTGTCCGVAAAAPRTSAPPIPRPRWPRPRPLPDAAARTDRPPRDAAEFDAVSAVLPCGGGTRFVRPMCGHRGGDLPMSLRPRDPARARSPRCRVRGRPPTASGARQRTGVLPPRPAGRAASVPRRAAQGVPVHGRRRSARAPRPSLCSAG